MPIGFRRSRVKVTFNFLYLIFLSPEAIGMMTARSVQSDWFYLIGWPPAEADRTRQSSYIGMG